MMMTDSQLRDYSADHLRYVVSMLYDTAYRLMHDAALDTDPVAINATVESFATQSRALAAFLYPDPDVKRKTDVTSDIYVQDVAAWDAARGGLPSKLHEVTTRTAKEIAHLTTERQPAGSPKKVWTPEKILRAFEKPLALFLDSAHPDRLAPTFIALAQSKLAPAASAAVPLDVRSTSSTASEYSVSVATARISHRTDGSTPATACRALP